MIVFILLFSISLQAQTVLRWSGGDPDSFSVVTYDVYFGDTTIPPLVCEGIADTFCIVTCDRYNTTYYWKVIAKDDSGAVTEGELWNFSTLDGFAPLEELKPIWIYK